MRCISPPEDDLENERQDTTAAGRGPGARFTAAW